MRIRAKRTNGKRSSLEAKVESILHKRGVDFTYETLSLPYEVTHSYKPDFLIKDGPIIEVKGYFTSKDRSKHLAIKRKYPHLDIRFIFGKPHNTIGKKSSTTYAMWCDRHGFPWCSADDIPTSWTRSKHARPR